MPLCPGEARADARVSGVRKVAVLRANGIGDLVFALPALEALKAAYPSAELVLLAREMHRELLGTRPGPVDRVIPVPRSRGVNGDERVEDDEPALERFFKAMADERFDIALQMHGGGRYSNPFLLRLGALLTAGMKSDDAPALDRNLPYVYLQHEVLRYLEVVSLVGAEAVTVEPALSVTPDDAEAAASVLAAAERPLVLLHPGASDSRRHWPAAGFAAVADALIEAGAQIALVGDAGEAGLTGKVMASARGRSHLVDLAGRAPLAALVGLSARCALFVGNDSGPLHLARAAGAATLGIYWCANMVNASPMTRLRHRALASWRVDCPVCGVDCLRETCPHRVSFVADVPAEEVIREALALFAAETS